VGIAARQKSGRWVSFARFCTKSSLLSKPYRKNPARRESGGGSPSPAVIAGGCHSLFGDVEFDQFHTPVGFRVGFQNHANAGLVVFELTLTSSLTSSASCSGR
jgi:hypothetical protein